jgi:hypothetical protein
VTDEITRLEQSWALFSDFVAELEPMFAEPWLKFRANIHSFEDVLTAVGVRVLL